MARINLDFGLPDLRAGLMGAAGAVGGIGGQIKEKQKREADKAALSQLTPYSSDYYNEVARQLIRDGKKTEAIRFQELARQIKDRQTSIAAAKKALGDDLGGKRQAAKDFASIGQFTEAMNVTNAVRAKEIEKGKTALARYMRGISDKGGDLQSLNVREGFDGIANAFGVPFEDASRIFKEASESKLTESQKADLKSDGYDPVNIEKYSTTGSLMDLGVADEDAREKMTDFEKTMFAAGIEKGSAEWMDYSKKYLDRRTQLEGGLSLVEQIQVVSKDLASNPVLVMREKGNSQAHKALDAIKRVKELRKAGEVSAEATRVIERTVSELYNSDSRAASEINRFLEGKGVTRAFKDWLGSTVSGEVSEESLGALEDLATLVRDSSRKEIVKLTESYLKLYDGVIDSKAEENIRNRYAKDYSFIAQRQIDKARDAQKD